MSFAEEYANRDACLCRREGDSQRKLEAKVEIERHKEHADLWKTKGSETEPLGHNERRAIEWSRCRRAVDAPP